MTTGEILFIIITTIVCSGILLLLMLWNRNIPYIPTSSEINPPPPEPDEIKDS